MKSGSPRTCGHCGADLPDGRIFYNVVVTFTAGFDGILPEPQGEDEIERALKAASEDPRTPEELEQEVHQQFELLLCLRCRKKLGEDLLIFGSAGEAERPPGALTQ